MENGIASWGVELSLFRTVVGREFEVVKRLRRNPKARNRTFFGAYGYFDLAAINYLTDLSAPTFLPIDCDIVETAPFRFFADYSNPPKADFLNSIRNKKSVIAVLLKIAPAILSLAPNEIRWRTAKFVRSKFDGAHVFFGLGFSEIFFLYGGNNLPELLNRVTDFRFAPQNERAFKSILKKSGADYFFVKTATLPFVSYRNVHRRRNFKGLKGEMHPVVTVSCDPSSEGPLIEKLQSIGMETRNSYGDTDLVVYWKQNKVPVSSFAKVLSEIRKIAGPIGSVQKTTSYLETPAPTKNQKASNGHETARPLGKLSEQSKAIFRLVDRVDVPTLKASVTDLWLRLMPCLSNPHLESGYLDMANTFAFIRSLLETIKSRKCHRITKLNARDLIFLACDLARIAINQRYAGLETHPETLAHSQSPILSDIRSLISAASCQPRFIFDNLLSGVPAERNWYGYIIFGTTYSHQWYPQDILALPAVSLYDPISEWWKTTHEAGHAVYHMLDLDRVTPKDILNELRLAPSNAERDNEELMQVVQELFANWFDWRFAFNRDTFFYLDVVWKSWLDVSWVWEKKLQYLTRTFTLFLARDFDSFHKVYERGNNELMERYIPDQWERFTSGIIKRLRQFKYYLNGLSSEEITHIHNEAGSLMPVMYFYDNKLESVCRVHGLEQRLNPPYPQLKQHLRAIEKGIVISGPIPNPCKLQVELLRNCRNHHPIPLKTQAAFILSLENSYLLSINKA